MNSTQPEHIKQTDGVPTVDPLSIRSRLLDWYDRSRRELPWRRRRDAYAIWLSEMMLQQTQIQTALPYYERFLEQWPDVTDLALATEEAVLKAWEGLGYYSRARHLHQTAAIIAGLGGKFPESVAELRRLPGIGAYTAGAIASIAFGAVVPAVDGNVVRVTARLAARPWVRGREADRRLIEQWLQPVIDPERPGDFNQALMDLGATLCLPKTPACHDCPLNTLCRAAVSGTQSQYPLRRPANRLTEEQKIVLIVCVQGRVRVNRRNEPGLLSGLYTFDWMDPDDGMDLDTCPAAITGSGTQPIDLGRHVHTFSHRRWQMQGWLVVADSLSESLNQKLNPAAGLWLSRRQLAEIPMARALSVFRDRLLEQDHCR